MTAHTSRGGLGLWLEDGTRVTHGTGGDIRRPLAEAPVVMHELYAGEVPGLAFAGQFGFIPFNTDCRLPRHVHMAEEAGTGRRRLLPERILVLNGVGIAELGGACLVVAPGSLVDIPAGLPHSWNACPPGVALPDGTVSDGTFTMVYNYAERTRFFPTRETAPLARAEDYVPHTGDLEEIRFPALSAEEVVATCRFVWNGALRSDLARAG